MHLKKIIKGSTTENACYFQHAGVMVTRKKNEFNVFWSLLINFFLTKKQKLIFPSTQKSHDF